MVLYLFAKCYMSRLVVPGVKAHSVVVECANATFFYYTFNAIAVRAIVCLPTVIACVHCVASFRLTGFTKVRRAGSQSVTTIQQAGGENVTVHVGGRQAGRRKSKQA
ncbi:hypothetical protein LCGC14_2785260 [marine sediment metagenome]|uniref:Uncharacterized protein n=1 Tax=marine sediment metagenome TaxID=412755 RepID=A0A0F8YS41_9ZZZZ